MDQDLGVNQVEQYLIDTEVIQVEHDFQKIDLDINQGGRVI